MDFMYFDYDDAVDASDHIPLFVNEIKLYMKQHPEETFHFITTGDILVTAFRSADEPLDIYVTRVLGQYVEMRLS